MDETKAREILKDWIQPDGGIHAGAMAYVCWHPNEDSGTLDGGFSIEELEAIVWWIRNRPANRGTVL